MLKDKISGRRPGTVQKVPLYSCQCKELRCRTHKNDMGNLRLNQLQTRYPHREASIHQGGRYIFHSGAALRPRGKS